MAFRERSISLPIVLASVAVALSIALLVGWTLVFSRYIEITKARAGGVPLLVLGIISFVIIMVVMVLIAVFLVREILDSRRHYRFMDSVTHELKSPLASMRLSAQTMANPRVKPEQSERLRQMILADIDRLTSVIDDILVAGRLDSGSNKLQWSEVQLVDAVDDALEAVLRRYESDGDVIENLVPDSVVLRTDKASFSMLVSNLIDNALKYSDRPRAIRIELYRASKGGANLCVIDAGIGISSAELRRVRRRFYRVASEEVRQRHGTGLGLYVVNGLASRIGAQFRIYSEGEGRGTTMILRMPEKYLQGLPEQLPHFVEDKHDS